MNFNYRKWNYNLKSGLLSLNSQRNVVVLAFIARKQNIGQSIYLRRGFEKLILMYNILSLNYNYGKWEYNLCKWFVKLKFATKRFVFVFYCMKAIYSHLILRNVLRMMPHTDHKWFHMKTVLWLYCTLYCDCTVICTVTVL